MSVHVQLPLAGLETFALTDPQYRRLFGCLTPEQVMVAVTPTSLRADGTDGSPLLLCAPEQAAGHPFSRAQYDIAAMRAHHLARGHTPATDAAHGWLFFWHGAQHFMRSATASRDPERRCKNFVNAAAMLVALIDSEDYLTQPEAAREE